MDKDFCLKDKRKIIYLEESVKEFIKLLKEDLKKEFCNGFVSLDEEYFEREWKKAINKRAGDLE